MESEKIDEAKSQVQGQLAAQYIQDVMQARADSRMPSQLRTSSIVTTSRSHRPVRMRRK